ncbi:hypothetical protein B0H15DRAFT_244146 [Mycena belliarum]|uniref:BTB domain-containing protein n=1 Tax=Mycena belliarum TaxID=1033014 RepID=A0AAD6U7A8_9AGAR|nr:hypothetical protein B0H15DRAFT_244146 [Mycena belliae]
MSDEETRVEELWFSNDTLVIRAEKKLFRVSKALLAARSSAFKDMIAFPQPASGAIEPLDGSPVVTLHDAAADVEVLLKAIFDSSYFMPAPEPVALQDLLGILRLSDKYDIQYLQRRALNHLSTGFYYSTVHDYRTYVQESRDHVSYPSALSFCSVVDAATAVGALWLLPVAYYKGSSFGRDALLAATQSGVPETIVQKLILANAGLASMTLGACDFLCSRSGAACQTHDTCDSGRYGILSRVVLAVNSVTRLLPLDRFGEKSWGLLRQRICASCCAAAQERRTCSLEALWDRLPSMYGLPPWPELHAMRAAAIGDIDSAA